MDPLLNAPIAIAEPAIIARLRIAFPEKTFGIERVPPTLTIREFERIARQTPFLGLAWTGIRPDAQSGRQLTGAMQWRLVIIIKAVSGLETRFKGSSTGVGLDAAIDVSLALLHAVEIDGVGASAVTGAQAVIADGWSDDSIAIAQVDFEIRYATSAARHQLTTADDFAALGIVWLNADSADPDSGPDAPQTIEP